MVMIDQPVSGRFPVKPAQGVSPGLQLLKEDDLSYPGPLSVRDGAAVIAIGDSWTRGEGAQAPFTRVLKDQYGIPVVNLGLKQAAPQDFEPHIDIINRHPCVMVQITTADVGAAFFDGGPDKVSVRADGLRIPDTETQEIFERFNAYRPDVGAPVPVHSRLPAEVAWNVVRQTLPDDVITHRISKARSAYVASMTRLMRRITGRKVLLCPEQQDDCARQPRLIDAATLNLLRDLANGSVDCPDLSDAAEAQASHDSIAATLAPYLQSFLDQHHIPVR